MSRSHTCLEKFKWCSSFLDCEVKHVHNVKCNAHCEVSLAPVHEEDQSPTLYS